jgi:2-isopropylmalate synthase
VIPTVRILDSTLREGEQTPGVCFGAHVRAAVADLLDALGVDVVEVGHPAVTDQIRESVAEISSRGLGAMIGAHARSLESDVDLALECDVGFLGIFYCVSDSRLRHHNRRLGGAVDRIAEVIGYAKSRRQDLVIRYTPEDTVRSSWENVVTAAASAVRAGADIISIADTTGHMIPGTDRSMYDYVLRLRDALAFRGLEPDIAVHCHNDRGLALANTLDGFRAGARVLDASVLGLGERAGLTDLATLLAVLAGDFGAGGRWDLSLLPELYRLVSKYSGVPVPVHQPVTGSNAFTHCAGVHTQAAIADPLHYQSLDPALVGRRSRIALDHMSGISAVRHSLEAIGEHAIDNESLSEILVQIKEIGQSGRIVDDDELRLIVSYLGRGRSPETRMEAVGG